MASDRKLYGNTEGWLSTNTISQDSMCPSCCKIRFTWSQWNEHFLLVTSQTLSLAASSPPKETVKHCLGPLTTSMFLPHVPPFASWFSSTLYPSSLRKSCLSVCLSVCLGLFWTHVLQTPYSYLLREKLFLQMPHLLSATIYNPFFSVSSDLKFPRLDQFIYFFLGYLSFSKE